MKKTVVLSFLLLISHLAYSQLTVKDLKKGNYGTPQSRAEEADNIMQKGLKLTPQQIPTVAEMNIRYAWRVENEVVKVSLSDWSRYRKITAIQDDKDKELKKVLNEEQFKKYKKKRDDMFWQGVKAYFF